MQGNMPKKPVTKKDKASREVVRMRKKILAIHEYLVENTKSAKEAQTFLQMLSMHLQAAWVETRAKTSVRDLKIKAETGNPDDNRRFRDLIKMVETENLTNGEGMITKLASIYEHEISARANDYGLEELTDIRLLDK